MGIKFWKSAAEAEPIVDESVSAEATMASYQLEGETAQAELTSYHSELSSKAKMYNKVVRVLLSIGAFFLPLFFLPWGTNILEPNKQILLIGIAGIGLVIWLLGIVISGQVSLRTNTIDKGVLAFLGSTLVVTIFSIAKSRSLFGASISLSESLLSIIALSVFYFLAVNVYDDHGKALKNLLTLSFLVALVYGLFQMLTWYIIPKSFLASRAFNTVGSLNSLGMLAAISLPLFNKVRLSISRWPKINFAWLGVAASLVILAILNWWVLWAVVIAGMLVTIALDSLGTAWSHGFKVSRFLMPMTVIVLGVFLMIVNFNVQGVKNNLPVEIAPSYKLSTTITKSVLTENLLFGYGPENFSLAFDKYGAKSLANSTLFNLRFYDSTSEFFNVVVHGGIVALLALLFMLWTLVETILKLRHHGGIAKLAENEGTGMIAALAGLVVALFMYPFNITLFFALYAFTALFVLQVWGEHRRVWNIEEKPLVSLASSLGFIIGLITVLAGSYFTTIQYLADTAYASALNQKDADKAVALLVKAINLNGNNDEYYRTSSQASLTLLSQELNKKGDAQQATKVQNFITSSIDLAKRSTVANPREVDNWYTLGNVYQSLVGLVDGVDRLAEEAYNKASDLRPGDPSYDNRVGSMYLAKADLERQVAGSAGANAAQINKNANDDLVTAEKYFKSAIAKSSNYGLAIYNLAAVYDRQNKVTDSIKQIEKIIPYNADQPSLLFELGLLYYRAGRKDDSFAALQRSVLLSPQFSNARWYLGLLYEEKGDFQNAIDQMDKILDNNKGNQVVMDKLDQLKKGLVQTPPKKLTDQKPL